MHPFPHYYTVATSAGPTGATAVSSPGLPTLEVDSPAEFGGPGDAWSPETLLVGAAADCLVLTFRAVARAARLEWLSLDVEASGTLDRVDHQTRFTEIHLRATLVLAAGADTARAEKLLQKAEAGCLITNSLSATVHLEPIAIVELSRSAVGRFGDRPQLC